jgi:hypothetical protein
LISRDAETPNPETFVSGFSVYGEKPPITSPPKEYLISLPAGGRGKTPAGVLPIEGEGGAESCLHRLKRRMSEKRDIPAKLFRAQADAGFREQG